MILKTGYGVEVQNADADAIAGTLKALSEREDDGDNFAILEASPDANDYIQTALNEDKTFCVEYREHGKKKHYAVDRVLLEAVVLLFQSYRNGNNSWKQLPAWNDVSDTMEW